VGEQSQSGFSNGVPADIFHRLQCSAGRARISLKLLILFGEQVVTEKGLFGSAAPETWRAEIGSPPPNWVNCVIDPEDAPCVNGVYQE
jgi:hypothetical protein